MLRLNGGEHEGKPFILHESQEFIVGSLFGWKGPDGFRRFRVAFVEIGKGNGKSPLAAGIGLYMMMADKEPRAEIYAAAVDKDQAQILFRDAVAMVNQSPHLAASLVKEWRRRRVEPCGLEDGIVLSSNLERTPRKGQVRSPSHCRCLTRYMNIQRTRWWSSCAPVQRAAGKRSCL